MTDIGWGPVLSECEGYGRLGDNSDDYKTLSPEERDTHAKNGYKSYQHASHGMIFFRKQNKLWDLYEQKGFAMTLGIIRVPLFTMGDGLRGFPAFLTNHFAGNARSELITGLMAAKLLTQDEMDKAVKAYKDFVLKRQ
ncbi:U8 snoRNA-decapping enzyme [Elysia marginata]|uniref:U8 snoRNA-decapping enzyme n=1 Tax=Elysia marginata TaxID=1093978 RepID=A0AAV4IYT9_9GAST|nr:U8 snoRNA-decapping enzyme [Elysia marginata]